MSSIDLITHCIRLNKCFEFDKVVDLVIFGLKH